VTARPLQSRVVAAVAVVLAFNWLGSNCTIDNRALRSGTGGGGQSGTGAVGAGVGDGSSGGVGGASGLDGGATAGSSGGAGTGGHSSGNLIVNGDFSDGDAHWVLTTTFGGPASVEVSNGQLCVAVMPGAMAILKWPSDPASEIALDADVSYELVYQAAASAPLASFGVVVGPAALLPASFDFYYGSDTPSGELLQEFMHSFTPAASDPAAGLAFSFASGSQPSTVCFDNVTLVPPPSAVGGGFDGGGIGPGFGGFGPGSGGRGPGTGGVGPGG
jgi:hypothetical protein